MKNTSDHSVRRGSQLGGGGGRGGSKGKKKERGTVTKRGSFNKKRVVEIVRLPRKKSEYSPFHTKAYFMY
jgi:hypothetical protein